MKAITTTIFRFLKNSFEKKERKFLFRMYKNIYINFIKGVRKFLNNRFKNSFSEETFLETSFPMVIPHKSKNYTRRRDAETSYLIPNIRKRLSGTIFPPVILKYDRF